MCHVTFQGHMPSPEMGVASDVLGVAQEKWAELWQSESPRKVTVQASSLASSGEKCCMCHREGFWHNQKFIKA